MIDDGVEKAELEFVSSITAPLYWVHRDSTGNEVMKNGSLFFMDAGKGVFAVTAAHVVEACLRDSESSVFQCMIGGNGPGRTVYLQQKNENAHSIYRVCDRIISTHQGLDIATLRVSRKEVELTGCTCLTAIERSWPPPSAEAGCAVMYAGFPGEARERLRSDEVAFGFLSMGARVTNAHETCVSIKIEREKLKLVFGNNIRDNYDFGGMSGGPVLEFLQTPDGRFFRRPTGVIFQGPNPNCDLVGSIEGLEIIRARPIHFINADGTLDVNRWDQSNP